MSGRSEGAAFISSSGYSDLNNHLKINSLTESEFRQWFVGLCDGEANFSINSNEFKDWLNFSFRIELHLDDLKILEAIKNRLKCGNVTVYSNDNRNSALFRVSDSESIKNKIIPIFDLFHLNTTKQLDFLAFKEAFFLFLNKEHLTPEGRDNIINLKKNYNNNRTNFVLSNKINITPYWLIGFIEGEGSFNFTTTKNTNWVSSNFSIAQTEVQKPLMAAIKDFLDYLGSEKNINSKKFKLIPRCGLDYSKARENTKAKYDVNTSSIYFIYKFFIPFLNKYNFLTKKHLDFLDWKIGVAMIIRGYHTIPKGRELLLAIANGMNNARLNSNKNIFNNNLNNTILSQIQLLRDNENNLGKILLDILGEPLYKLGNQGELIDILTGKRITKTKLFILIPSGVLNQNQMDSDILDKFTFYFDSIDHLIKFFDLKRTQLYKCIKNNQPILHKNWIDIWN